MSTILHVDSRWRDRSNPDNLNPAEFTISSEIVKGWATINRTVQSVRPHNKIQMVNMQQSVKLFNLVIPYDIGGAIASGFVNLVPTLYVQLQNVESNIDNKLVNTLENGIIVNTTPSLAGPTVRTSLKDVVFVLHYDKTQYGSDGPHWLHYKSSIIQTYRILNPVQALKFRIFTPDGITIPIVDNLPPSPIDPKRQVNALFELTPYARDADYDHHFSSLYDEKA